MSFLQTPDNFNWPLAYEAEALLSRHITAFLGKNPTAARLAQRMHDETGTEFFEWVDHFVVSTGHEVALRAAGFTVEPTEAPAGHVVYAHPHAMLPRVIMDKKADPSKAPRSLAIRAE